MLPAHPRLLVPQEWRELLQFINQAAVAPEPPAREVAFKLLQSMSESVTKFVKDSFPQLQPMLLRGLADAESVVRVRALRALNTIAGSLENEREAKVRQLSASLPSLTSPAPSQ